MPTFRKKNHPPQDLVTVYEATNLTRKETHIGSTDMLIHELIKTHRLRRPAAMRLDEFVDQHVGRADMRLLAREVRRLVDRHQVLGGMVLFPESGHSDTKSPQRYDTGERSQ